MNSAKSRLWTPQFILIIFVTFLFFLCLQMLTAGFPVFVTGLKSNPAEGGLMTTVFMLAAIFTRPVIGILIHKMNIKRILVFTLLLVTGVIFLSYGQTSLSFLVMIRILHGIGFGIGSTLLATLATTLIPHERLGEGIGYFGMATSLGTTLGPSLALSFVHSFSFNVTILVTAAIAVLGFIMSLLIKNTGQPQKSEPKIEQKGSIMQYAFDKNALLPCFLVFLFYLTFSGIVNFINGLGEEVHLGGKVSIFFLLNAIVTVLIRPFSGKIYDRMGHKYLIYPACLAGISGLVIMSLTRNFATLIVAAIVYGIAYGIMQPTFLAWAVSRVTPDKKGTANAMALSFMDLGMALGAISLGGVADQFDYRSMYGISSLLIVILLILYSVANAWTRKNRKPQMV
jgi:predicted MFS family arabinose efflux permease